MYPPTATAESAPTFCAREAVPRIVLTRPTVRTSSVTIAFQSRDSRARLGRAERADLAVDRPEEETRERRTGELREDVAGNATPGKSRRRLNASVTAGFRCAPETAPMKKMTAITMSPGAATAAVRLIAP